MVGHQCHLNANGSARSARTAPWWHLADVLLVLGSRISSQFPLCSNRFHSLEEFDEGKRSCRKCLDGHNRRRRRPQLDSSRVASLFAGHQVTTMLQFSSPHAYQATTLTNPVWTGMVKSEEEATRHSNLKLNNQSSPISKKVAEKQQFSVFHNSGSHLKLNHQTSPPKVCQQPLLTFEANSSYDKLFCDGYTSPARLQPVVQSDCALSLLSSSPSCCMVQMGLHHHHASPDNGSPQTLPFY